MPSAPLGVSSQSRKKLKAFAFDEKLLANEEDKENQTSESAPSRIEQDEAACNEQPDVPVPHTPAVRIPIEDLIANTEDAYNCAPPLATPIDHVLWQANPESSDASIVAGATQRSRKRAHSSSPVSSQQRSAHKDALDLDILHKSLRTPNHDPTQDLWNRYTTAIGLKKETKEPTLPAYAHLLPSSPRTPSTTDKDGGFRRTHSCGVEWPASKTKRRKLDEQHSRTKELFAASRKDILRRDLSNNTRVGLLLEKIQESLSKKVDAPESPSSSSPLPDRRSQALVSPTRPQTRARQGSNGPHGASHSPVKGSPLKHGTSRDTSFSSEFSDEGLDIEAFESVEQALAQTQAEKAARAAMSDHAENALSQPYHDVHVGQTDGVIGATSQSRSVGKQAPAVPPKTLAATDFDEFDDDDDDEDLMNEMLDLAARYDSQPQAVGMTQPPAVELISQANTQPKRLETLDEFDDAFDDDDELWDDLAKATPAKGRTPVGSKDHVRFE